MSTQNRKSRTLSQWSLIWLATIVSYGLLGSACLALGSIAGTGSPFWLPSGLVVAVSLKYGYRALPGVFIGQVLFALIFEPGPVAAALALGVGNVLEGALVAGVAPRMMQGDDPLGSVRNFFALFAALSMGGTVNAAIGSLSLLASGLIPNIALGHVMLSWGTGDIGGALIVAPVLFAWWNPHNRGWLDRRLIEYLCLIAAVTGVSYLVFGEKYQHANMPLAFVLMPLLLWAALRFGSRGCTLINALTIGIVIWGTAHGYGPFGADSAVDALLFIQSFTSVIVITSLVMLIVNQERNRAVDALRHRTDSLEATVMQRTQELTVELNERKQAQASVIESRALLQTIIDTAPMRVFWKDRELRYLGCNPTFAQDAGKSSAAALIGKDDYEMSWAAHADQYRADDLRVMESGLAELSYEEPQTTPDGKTIWLRTSKTPLRNQDQEVIGILGTYEDVTELKRAEANLREKDEKLRALFKLSRLGIALAKMDGGFVEVNDAFLRITGYDTDELLSLDYWALTPREYEADEQAQLKSLRETGAYGPYEKEYIRKDGRRISIRLNGVMVHGSDQKPYIWSVVEDMTGEKQKELQIWRQANFDPLTELPNRRMFQDRLSQEAKRADRGGLPMAVLMIDLDRFKEVNDTLGHDRGDQLLIKAARRIQSCVRESDSVARIGGDEFAAILPDLDNAAACSRIAQEIIDRLSDSFELGEQRVFVSASIGITFYPDDSAQLEGLLKNADQAMYAAKAAGRNRFAFFKPAMQERALARLRLATELREALTANQFRVFYQPIVNLRDGSIVKAEALLRWQHPVLGAVSPAEFIPVAEETRLIVPIGDWVFEQVVRQVKQWRDRGNPDFQISINKSPVQIRNDPPQSWAERLQAHGVEGNSIVVEITEGILLNAETNVNNKLLRFRDAGIQVAIDDFGTGYSSLAYLKEFDIDYLKIDQSFVRDLGTDPNDLALCEAIIVMSHKLGLKVIAEGVESEQQRRILQIAGCDYAQGYLFSRPIPPEEFEVLLQHQNDARQSVHLG